MALLRGELAWVGGKCRVRGRERRYGTSSCLAREDQRYLADEPVDARPRRPGSPLRKFVRRHRGPVSAALLVLLALVGGVVGTSWGLVRTGQARDDEAEQRRAAVAERDQKESARAAAEAQRARAEQAEALATARLA